MKSILKTLAAAGLTAALFATPVPASVQGHLVYIPMGSDGTIVVVDTKTDLVVEKLTGFPAVHGLGATPDGKFLVAGSYEVRKAGEAAPEKPKAVSEEDHAAHHKAPPEGTADNSEESISSVTVFRRADQTVVRRIDVPGAVHHVAVSPNGRFAVVTHPAQGSISVIDLTTYQFVANVATGPVPNYATFSPDGAEVYVSNAGNGTVSAVDTGSWYAKWKIAVGESPEHLVLSQDGGTLFVNNIDDGTVSVLDLASRNVTNTIPVGAALHGIDLSDDEKTLIVADLGDDRLVAVDLASGTQRAMALSPAPYHLKTIRGAGKIYVSSSDDPIVWVIDADTLKAYGKIDIGGKGHQMVQMEGRS